MICVSETLNVPNARAVLYAVKSCPVKSSGHPFWETLNIGKPFFTVQVGKRRPTERQEFANNCTVREQWEGSYSQLLLLPA